MLNQSKIIMAVIVIILAALIVSFAFAGELQISKIWCSKMGGKAEYRLEDNTRVDCLLVQYAVEAEYTHKWYEAIGQSLYYAMMTNRQPGILFIREKGDEAYKARIDRFMKKHTEFKVWWTGE